MTRLEQNLAVLALPQSATTLANGSNNNVALNKGLLVKINGPTAAFNVTGLGGGTTGKIVTLYNPTAQAFTIRNDNTGSAAGNRIITMTGADVTLTGPSFVLFVYSIDHWLMLSSMPSSGGGMDTDFYQTVQSAGVDQTQRGKLNFTGTGVAVSDDGVNNRTTVTITEGTGTVTSVAQTVPVEFTISGSPVTTSGTLAIDKAVENANTVWAGPIRGAAAQPTFRSLQFDDLPTFATIVQSWTSIQNDGAAPPSVSVQTVNGTGGPNEASSGAAKAAVSDATGYYINYTSGTGSASPAGWTNGPANVFGGIVITTDMLPDIKFIWKSGPSATDIANIRFWAYVLSTGGINNTDDLLAAGTSQGFGFRFSTVAGDSSFQLSSSDGTTANTSSTGVSLTADTRYIFRMIVTSTSNVNFFINASSVGSITTHLPSGTKALQPAIYVINQGAGTSRNIRIRQALLYST